MSKKIKTVWVFSGGGNQTSYACGACLAVKDLKIQKPDLIVSGSGGTANAFYSVAGQIDLACYIWKNELSSKKILNAFRFWKIFDRDFMVDKVFMSPLRPLDLESIKNSSVKIYVGVTDSQTGKIKFFSNQDNLNLVDLLKATMSVPFFSGIFKDSSVKIKSKKYIDSRASSRPEFLIEKALSFNPKEILVFGDKPVYKYRYFANFWHDLWLFWKMFDTFSLQFTKNQIGYMKRQKNFRIRSNSKIIYLGPGEKLKIAPWSNSKQDLKKAVNEGYFRTLKNKEL